MANVKYNNNNQPKENEILVYNEASDLMEWMPLNQAVDKTYITKLVADSGQTVFSLTTHTDSQDRVSVYVDGVAKSFTLGNNLITLDSALDSGDILKVSQVPDSAANLGVIYWNAATDSVRWGTLVDLVDSTPSGGDIAIYDSSTQRMTWGRAPTMVSVIFGEFGDAGGERTYDSAPSGSYISGTGGSVTGGGLSGQSLSSGVLLGPLDGTSITITAVEGDIVIVTRPV